MPTNPIDPASTVPIAFAVGWQMAELFHGSIATEEPTKPTKPPEDLPGLSRLHPLQINLLHLEQVGRGLADLLGSDVSAVAGAVDAVRQSLPAATGHEAETEVKIAALHELALTALTVADFRLGKAYGLGRALAETALLPCMAEPMDRVSVYRDKLRPGRLQNLYQWLADLKTALPDHASYVVSWSLRQWENWMVDPRIAGTTVDWNADGHGINSAMRRQGKQWRAILSGERDCRDWLTAFSYVDAAKGLSSELGRTVGAFVSRYKGTVAVFVVGLVAIAGGIAFAAVISGNAKWLWAEITAVVGAVGGWKGISGTLGRGLKAVEEPLWQSELDAVIASKVMFLPKGAMVAKQFSNQVGLLPADDRNNL
jgi:hypothetical protein